MEKKGKKTSIRVLFVAALLIGIVIAPVVLATPNGRLAIDKPMPGGTLKSNLQSIDNNSKSPAELPASVVNTIKSTSTSGDWVYLGQFSDSVADNEWDYWQFDAPSGTTRIYVYLSWSDSNNDLDLYIWDHDWNQVDNSIQVNTDWEKIDYTTAYKARWYLGVNGYDVSGSQQYTGDVWTYVETHEGEATPHPWSGWWWPMLDDPAYAPHMYDSDGPMEKYDTYVVNGGGSNPGGNTWEYDTHRTTDPDNSWWGHCHAWAAAAILETTEPTTSKTKRGVDFAIGDQKGLLTECHYDDPVNGDFWGTRYNGPDDDINDIYPHDFHNVLLDEIGADSTSVVMDTCATEQVWNYPAYMYSMKYDPDIGDPSKTHVTCTVWFADDNVDPDYVGTDSFTKTYYYYLTGGTSNPTGGAWEGDSVNDHPDFVWHPESQQADEGCPLNYNTVKEIVS